MLQAGFDRAKGCGRAQGYGRVQGCGPGWLLFFVVEVAVAFFHGIREVDQVEEVDLGIFR